MSQRQSWPSSRYIDVTYGIFSHFSIKTEINVLSPNLSNIVANSVSLPYNRVCDSYIVKGDVVYEIAPSGKRKCSVEVFR